MSTSKHRPMGTMRFIDPIVSICQASQTGSIWAGFQTVVMLFVKPESTLSRPMGAISAHENVIPVDSVVVPLCPVVSSQNMRWGCLPARPDTF